MCLCCRCWVLLYILSSNHLTMEQILFQLSEKILTDIVRFFHDVSPVPLRYARDCQRESKVLLIMVLLVEAMFLILFPASSSLVYSDLGGGEMSLTKFKVVDSDLVSSVWFITMVGLQWMGNSQVRKLLTSILF